MSGFVRVHSWLDGPTSEELRRLVTRLERAPDVQRIALMPDAHVAETVAVGCVVATTRILYPEAVGGDLGCGMAALRFDCTASALTDPVPAARVLAGFGRHIPAIRHGRATAVSGLPPDLDGSPLSAAPLESRKRRDGRVQFGTLGRGNHFVEVLADEEERMWLVVHTGSRGIGRAIFEHHLREVERGPDGLVGLPAESPAGQAYLSDLAWALEYADQNRERVLERAATVLADVLGAPPTMGSHIACHHNHVRREVHGETPLWVHRKGAIVAAEGVPGIVPGSMGTASFIVEGRGHPDSLDSSAHGAGRALSRTAARSSITSRDLERQMKGVWFDHRQLDALRDEAPTAYKDIHAVLRAQRDLTRVRHRLRPLLNYKGC
jgi:tRNA-splicing ligase RtcB